MRKHYVLSVSVSLSINPPVQSIEPEESLDGLEQNLVRRLWYSTWPQNFTFQYQTNGDKITDKLSSKVENEVLQSGGHSGNFLFTMTNKVNIGDHC